MTEAITWSHRPGTNTYTTELGARTVTLDPSPSGWEVWYGKAGRRLRVGKVDTLRAARSLAEDLVLGLLKLDRNTGE